MFINTIMKHNFLCVFISYYIIVHKKHTIILNLLFTNIKRGL